jgi:phage terminase large subunit
MFYAEAPSRLQADQRAIALTPKQQEFCTSRPITLYRGGIASGKTVAGITKPILRRYQYPGTWQLVGGPSWDQVRDGTMASLKRLLNPKCIVYENKVDHVMGLNNGSGFIFRTLTDPDVLRSLELHDVYIDECAMCSEEAFNIALGRIRLKYNGLVPEGSAPFINQLWGTTTPRATDWTLDVFGMEGKPGYGVVHSTIYDNRQNLPEGYIERLEAKYGDTPFYEQELLGMYTAFEGLVYPMFNRDKHVKHDPWPLHDSESIAVGVDFGGTADPSAMVLIGERHNRQHVFAEFYKLGAYLDQMLEQLDLWTWSRTGSEARCSSAPTLRHRPTTTIHGEGLRLPPGDEGQAGRHQARRPASQWHRRHTADDRLTFLPVLAHRVRPVRVVGQEGRLNRRHVLHASADRPPRRCARLPALRNAGTGTARRVQARPDRGGARDQGPIIDSSIDKFDTCAREVIPMHRLRLYLLRKLAGSDYVVQKRGWVPEWGEITEFPVQFTYPNNTVTK